MPGGQVSSPALGDSDLLANTQIGRAARRSAVKSVSSARTRIERNFDPGMVRQLKSATEHDMTVGSAGLARSSCSAGARADRPDPYRRGDAVRSTLAAHTGGSGAASAPKTGHGA
jgi:hypothetical protein